MDWVHCNSCFYQPGQIPKRDFKLTSCGHIFCHNCERSGIIDACKMCGVKSTTTPLSSQMAKEIKMYFEDPEEAHAKLKHVMEFQKSHRQRLFENYRRVFEKYQMLKANYTKLEEENKGLKNQLEMFKRTNKHEVDLLTPPQPTSQFPLFHRNSQASKVIRRGLSQPSSSGSLPSPLLVTPSNNFASQQYRKPKLTPSTPGSDFGSSPATSITSNYDLKPSRSSTNINYPNRANPTSMSQQYQTRISPAIHSLRLLSVKPRY